MYLLHYAPDNASLIIRIVMTAAGLPFTTALVDRRTGQQNSPAYRALNPQGLIPTLETPDGPLSETGAILLWLADRHALGPRAGDAARVPFLKWLFFLSNTAHADLRQLFYPHRYCPPEAIPGHHDILTVRMRQHFQDLDASALAHPALFAPATPLATYTCALLRWSVLYPRGQTPWLMLDETPTLAALARAMDDHPATCTAIAAEGLGPTPFSAPRLATPPEGSAT